MTGTRELSRLVTIRSMASISPPGVFITTSRAVARSAVARLTVWPM